MEAHASPRGGKAMRAEDRYDSLIQFYAEKHGLPWPLLKRQMLAESGANPRAVSPAGAMGLMQFMPETWREYGSGDPFNPEASIEAGCRYMAALFGRFAEIPDEQERWCFALAAYNAGPGNVNRMLALARGACGQPASYKEWERAGRPAGPWQTWGFASRFLERVTGRHAAETLAYVERIMGAKEAA